MGVLNVVAVIPARYGSTRFPGKPLHPILGKPMIQWVVERVKQARLPARTIVATDDAGIAAAARAALAEVVMTDSHHKSGTDRVAEAVANIEADVVVNVQGDEPLISGKAVDQVISPFLDDEEVQMATLCRRAMSQEEIQNPNTVRVVFDHNHNALYFSRAPIPFARDENPENWLAQGAYYQHIGIYAYRKSFLLHLASLPQTHLEKVEKLEQLRVLESGFSIRVVETDYTPICVDVPEDVERVEQELKKMGFVND